MCFWNKVPWNINETTKSPVARTSTSQVMDTLLGRSQGLSSMLLKPPLTVPPLEATIPEAPGDFNRGLSRVIPGTPRDSYGKSMGSLPFLGVPLLGVPWKSHWGWGWLKKNGSDFFRCEGVFFGREKWKTIFLGWLLSNPLWNYLDKLPLKIDSFGRVLGSV